MCRGRCDTVLAKHRANSYSADCIASNTFLQRNSKSSTCNIVDFLVRECKHQIIRLSDYPSSKNRKQKSIMIQWYEFGFCLLDLSFSIVFRTSHRWSFGVRHGVLPCPTRQKKTCLPIHWPSRWSTTAPHSKSIEISCLFRYPPCINIHICGYLRSYTSMSHTQTSPNATRSTRRAHAWALDRFSARKWTDIWYVYVFVYFYICNIYP